MSGPRESLPNGILQFANLVFGVSGNEQFVVSACKSEYHDEQDDVYLGRPKATRRRKD